MVLFVNKKNQKNFVNLGHAGFSGTGPVSRKFLHRFFQKAVTFFLSGPYCASTCAMPSQPLRAIGLMSGTSLDGVDAAWLETDGETITRFGPAATLHYQDDFRAELRQLLELAPRLSPDDPLVQKLTQRLTMEHAIAVVLLGQAADVIGFHGQTILHDPERHRTWQIGDGKLLAKICRTKVVYRFSFRRCRGRRPGRALGPALPRRSRRKARKAAAGGEYRRRRQCHLSGRRRTKSSPAIAGRATGRSTISRRNILGQPYDKDGAFAASGRVDEARLGLLLAHPYFALPAPKSLDRLTFSQLIAAATEHIAAGRCGGHPRRLLHRRHRPRAPAGAAAPRAGLRRRAQEQGSHGRARCPVFRAGRDGGSGRLGRRRAGGAVLRLSRGALAARPAAVAAQHHRRCPRRPAAVFWRRLHKAASLRRFVQAG